MPHDGVMVNSGPFDGETVACFDREGDRVAGSARVAARPRCISGCATGCSAASGTGGRRSRSSIARRAVRSPCPTTSCPWSCPPTPTSSWAGSRRWPATPPGSTWPARRAAARPMRDTDTMDTFVDSSWYFFRYCSPGYEDGPFRREDVDRWMPVGQYTGGVEHAILHLLYSRFFTKVLYDLGMVGFTEPFPKLMNQGQVIYDGCVHEQVQGQHRGAHAAGGAVGLGLHAPDHAVRRPVHGRHRLEADRGRRGTRRPGVHAWLGRVFSVVARRAVAGRRRTSPSRWFA